jgi:hypothetical protein
MGEQGNPRELECCIRNQLMPENENCWVEAVFISGAGEQFKLRRVLTYDYGSTQTSRAESKLLLNGQELNASEESGLWFNLFAGVPPVLMQHTMGVFVHSTPAQRRSYFEQLLRLEELTYLIEKSVVGDARLPDFPSPLGGVAIRAWDNLKSVVRQRSSKAALRNAESGNLNEPQVTLGIALVSVAKREFPNLARADAGFDEIEQSLTNAQRRVRQQKFPLLDGLRPRRAIDDGLLSTFDDKSLKDSAENILNLFDALASAHEAARHMGEMQRSVAQAYDLLAKAGVIAASDEAQVCPLCDYRDIATLTADRKEQVLSWQPLEQAAQSAETAFVARISELRIRVELLSTLRENLIPTQPTDDQWDETLKQAEPIVREAVAAFRSAYSTLSVSLRSFDDAIATLTATLHTTKLTETEQVKAVQTRIDDLVPLLQKVITSAHEYSSAYQSLDRAVAALVRDDPDYSLRESWLTVVKSLEDVAVELRWELAKKKAQAELATIRDTLINARTKLLNARREHFGSEINSIWAQLRADRYSAFSRLFIPEPRGRGFPVEIEVKAVLDDGAQKVEVDALRVFSESQINVLGLAAFITRAKLLGHRMLILDDPVQSMDEEHFKTFSSNLIQRLLSDGFQVIMLTHNDTFAREVSFACTDVEGYVTMQIRHSRRKGCQVDEGNRRVAERLKIAEHKAEEGEFDNAWRAVRLALERLYTVAHMKHGPRDFAPMSWVDQTAESMWNAGAGEVIESLVPGSGVRLKDILGMSAAGAHDKSAKGMTDLTNAVADVRALMTKLRVGEG